MITTRLLAVGAGSLLLTLGIATVAQAAYTATRTMTSSGHSTISTIDCSALTILSTGGDWAETEDRTSCSSVSVRIFYTNGAGYSTWTSTVTSGWTALIELTGNNQAKQSYHTATR